MEGSMLEETDENPTPTVLPSSTELFYFYGQTMEQCGKYTTGEPLKKLGKVFAKWLKVYSGTVSPFTERKKLIIDDVLLTAMKRYVYL
jgi:hypothetical protein